MSGGWKERNSFLSPLCVEKCYKLVIREEGGGKREEERRRGLKEKGRGVKGFKKSSQMGFLTLLNFWGDKLGDRNGIGQR